jgi:hypothetical protein
MAYSYGQYERQIAIFLSMPDVVYITRRVSYNYIMCIIACDVVYILRNYMIYIYIYIIYIIYYVLNILKIYIYIYIYIYVYIIQYV